MIKRFLFLTFWVLLVAFLVMVSFRYRSSTEAMVAVVESQVIAISYQKPVIIESIRVASGQQVKKGDTLIIVSRPDLSLDIDKKTNELERLQSRVLQEEQDFESKRALVRIDTEGKINRLEMDLAELKTKQARQKSMNTRLKALTDYSNGQSFSDSLNNVKIKSIQQEINDTKSYAYKEVERLKIRMQDELSLLEREISLVNRELESLKDEYNLLVKIANSDGIVGTVSVQLDELVPPYNTVITLFEKHPSLIKAYMNEQITYPIQPGDEVSIVSENRKYKINGVVREMGARITDYPTKIEPSAMVKSYGQEVFIKIPKENNFLNGEKVYVYPIVKK